MSGMRDQADVMYVSSFTKLLGCGLRVGFGVLPPAVKAALPRANAENLPRRNASHLATMLVYEYMRDHEAEHIEAVRKALQVRRDAMLEALAANFPAFCEWTEPQGGMMIFVRLPEGADTWGTLEKATQRDVKYNPGGMFRSDRDRNNHFRLTYSTIPPPKFTRVSRAWPSCSVRKGTLRARELHSHANPLPLRERGFKRMAVMTTIAGPAAPPTITVSVDGLSVAVSVGASALDAINASGVVISQLCKDADMPAIGACRTCLVQIDGVRGFPASCSVPVTEGMVIHTDTADVRRIRSGVIELTLGMVNGGHPSPPAPLPVGEGSTPLTLVLPRGGTEFVAGGDHPHPDPLPSRERGDVGRDTVPSISGGGDHPDPLLPSRERGDVGRDTVPARRGGVDGYGQLSAAAELHGIVERRWEARERPATDTSNPVFNLAMDACILCARCVNACQSAHQFIGAIDVLGAGKRPALPPPATNRWPKASAPPAASA